MRKACFLVPGGLDRITGGNVYDRAAIETLRGRGWDVEVREPPSLGGPWDVVVVDSLAFRFGRPQTRDPYVGLVHQIPSAVAGYPEPTVQERDLLQFAALVVTVADWLRDAVARFTSAPIEVIPPGRDRAWARDGRREDADTVLCVANAMPGKGVPEAIDAFARAKPHGAKLVLAGDMGVDGEEAERVRAALDRCDAPVELAGVADAASLSARYARARVLLTGTRYEGRPIAVAEAMASGVPVAGFDVSGVREMVRPGRDGLLARPGDVDDLATCVSDLLEKRDLSDAMSAAARERALTWPTWPATAKRFADAIERLVERDRDQDTVAR